MPRDVADGKGSDRTPHATDQTLNARKRHHGSDSFRGRLYRLGVRFAPRRVELSVRPAPHRNVFPHRFRPILRQRCHGHFRVRDLPTGYPADCHADRRADSRSRHEPHEGRSGGCDGDPADQARPPRLAAYDPGQGLMHIRHAVTDLHGFGSDGRRVSHHLGLIGLLTNPKREAVNVRGAFADAVRLDGDLLRGRAADEEQD